MATPEPRAELLPDRKTLLGWIETIFDRGIRRPGYPADAWCEEWAAARFRELGLAYVELDPHEVLRWEPRRGSLAVWPAGRPAERRELPGFPVPYARPTPGLRGSLVSLGNGASVADRIAVVEHQLLSLPQAAMRALATDAYDPEGELADLVQVLPFGARLQNVMEPAIEAGATGFVGLLDSLPWESDQHYVPYDAERRPIPGLWLGPASARELKERLRSGPLEAELVADAELVPAVSHNVTGVLPGASDEWVVIASHHDGPWRSAVEDASGVALVLGQAHYWSRVPERERPHNLLFLLQGGHMAGAVGAKAFVQRHAGWLDRVVLELHLEHVAREAKGVRGRLVPTDRPEVRWWFTSRIAELEAAVKETLVAERLDRSLVIAPDGFPPGAAGPPTDAHYFHGAGVPLVSLLAAPMYLFDAADTLEMVHEESLVPLSRAAARLVAWTKNRSAAGLRAAATRPALQQGRSSA